MNKVNHLQIESFVKMERYATVTVPAFEFKFNLVVCPLPVGKADVSLLKSMGKYLLIYLLRGKAGSML